MKRIFYFLLPVALMISCQQPQDDVEVIASIYEEALSDSTTYHALEYLSNEIGGRLACSPEGIEAAYYTKSLMEDLGFDKVYLQEAKVKNWDQGDPEVGYILDGEQQLDVAVCALGRGIGTGEEGLKGKVVEVESFDALNALPREEVEGKIVFFNAVMNPNYDNSFRAYGETSGYRFVGPVEAAKKGAKAAIIRSLATSVDTFPHTGVTRYAEDGITVPAVAIATAHANLLSERLKENTDLDFYFRTTCENKPDTITYNTIGEIRGNEFPNKIITIGGHLDSWYNSPGAHDDGGGCMQAVEVLRLFKELGIQPKHTLRAVMFMDEEISQGGAAAYFEAAKANGEEHIFAMESDRGVTRPLGFTIDGDLKMIRKINSWAPLFAPYDVRHFEKGYGGVDINPLKELGTTLIGYYPDPTHYFEWHHSPNDTFDKVVFEEYQKGSATMAALIYLLDKYGVEEN